ncbi:hypothetical protein MRX96_035904 [Rhipicephalus microplus]
MSGRVGDLTEQQMTALDELRSSKLRPSPAVEVALLRLTLNDGRRSPQRVCHRRRLAGGVCRPRGAADNSSRREGKVDEGERKKTGARQYPSLAALLDQYCVSAATHAEVAEREEESLVCVSTVTEGVLFMGGEEGSTGRPPVHERLRSLRLGHRFLSGGGVIVLIQTLRRAPISDGVFGRNERVRGTGAGDFCVGRRRG